MLTFSIFYELSICYHYGIYNCYYLFLFVVDDLPTAPGLSDKLKINASDDNSTLSIFPTNTQLEDEFAEDVKNGEFWGDEVPEVVDLPNTNPEPILVEEIEHIKVIIYNY